MRYWKLQDRSSPNFQGWETCWCRCSIWCWFPDWPRDVAMALATNPKSATRLPSWDSHSKTDGSIGKQMGALIAQKSCLHCAKIGELWFTNSRDYDDYLVTIYARSWWNAFDSRDSIWQWMAGTTELNGFAPNSHGGCVWFFAGPTLNVKVEGQRARSPGTKMCCAQTTPHGGDEMECTHCKYRHASSRRDDLIAAEGCLRQDACTVPGGLLLGSATQC